jgi:hypothetical protein
MDKQAILFKERVYVEAAEAEMIQRILDNNETPEGWVKDRKVTFADGAYMVIQLCCDVNNHTKAALCSAEGNLLGISDLRREFLGEYYVRGYLAIVATPPPDAEVRGRILEERTILCRAEDTEWAIAQADTAARDGWDVVRSGPPRIDGVRYQTSRYELVMRREVERLNPNRATS